jgi:hypothetical protein
MLKIYIWDLLKYIQKIQIGYIWTKVLGTYKWRPEYVYIVVNGIKYFLFKQQCKCNQLLHVCGSTEFCIVDSDM